MDPTRTTNGIRVGGDARQRLYHARGYGEPVGERDILLAPVEAAHLLYREDIPHVDGADFATFCQSESSDAFLTRFLVYKDVRDRGYYLSPWPAVDTQDFVVFERGSDPRAEQVAFRVHIVDERTAIDVDTLAPGVIAMVDEEGEVGYVELTRYTPAGELSLPDVRNVAATIIGNRVIAWDPPTDLYAGGFFGQPVAGRNEHEGALQLSLVEALYLAQHDILELDPERVREQGRTSEASTAFDARSRVYTALRAAGSVPKTGFKFGAAYRVYHEFDGIDAMGHSAVLIRILDRADRIDPASLALDVRLAHGVGKRMVFAIQPENDTPTISWLSVTRMTP